MSNDIYSKELAHYFDMLRTSRKMSLDDLTYDIVSVRQFRRYIRGEYQMPQIVFNKLASRLGFKPEHILLEFESIKLQETNKINKLHNAVVNKDYPLAKILINEIDPNHLIERNNQVLYYFSKGLMDYYLKNISPNTFVDMVKELVNYSSIFEKTIHSSTEVILITSLLPLKEFNEKSRVIRLIENFVENQKSIVSGNNDRLILLSLYYLADYSGTQGKFEEVIKYCNKGISICMSLKYNYLLQDFYYFSALANHYLENNDLKDNFLFKCFCVLNSESNDAKKNNYYKMIESDFNLDFDLFIVNYIKGNIIKK